MVLIMTFFMFCLWLHFSFFTSNLVWFEVALFSAGCCLSTNMRTKQICEDQEVSQGVLSRFENEQKGHRCQPGPGWPQKLTGCSWYIRWRTDRIFRKDLCIYRNFANWEIFLQLKLEWQEIWVSLEWERNSRTRFSRHPLARVSTVHLLVEPKPDNLLFFLFNFGAVKKMGSVDRIWWADTSVAAALTVHCGGNFAQIVELKAR